MADANCSKGGSQVNAKRVEETEAEVRELKSHRAVKRGEIELTNANWQNVCCSVSQIRGV